MDLKDLLGGKGANLAEMTSVLGLPVPPGSPSPPRPAAPTWPPAGPGPRRRARPPLASLEGDGHAPRRRRRSAARLRALRSPVLDAGDDGHGPEPRAQRRVVGASPRQRASASPTTPTAASVDVRQGRAGPRRRAFDERSSRPRPTRGVATDAELGAEASRPWSSSTRRRSRPTPARPFPRTRRRSCATRSRPCSGRWNGAAGRRLPRPRAHPRRPRHRGERPGDGVRQPRRRLGHRRRLHARPGTGETVAYGDFLLNAQGEDVVAGVRTTEPLDAMADGSPRLHAELLDMHERLERTTATCST